jgi:hypothetical protein
MTPAEIAETGRSCARAPPSRRGHCHSAGQRDDELQLKRLKRRKLQLKDCIARLESALIPDEPA